MHLHLLFVLPLVTGFASLPGEECFFLYSAEPSLAYLLVPGNIPDLATLAPTDPEDVGKVGKVWEGVKLEIKGPETVEPETVTAQDAIARFPASLATMSETFCLPAHVEKVVLCPYRALSHSGLLGLSLQQAPGHIVLTRDKPNGPNGYLRWGTQCGPR